MSTEPIHAFEHAATGTIARAFRHNSTLQVIRGNREVARFSHHMNRPMSQGPDGSVLLSDGILIDLSQPQTPVRQRIACHSGLTFKGVLHPAGDRFWTFLPDDFSGSGHPDAGAAGLIEVTWDCRIRLFR